jgi:hypothetical protein
VERKESLGKIIIISGSVVRELKFCLTKVRAYKPEYNNIVTRLGTEFRTKIRARAAPLQIISADAVVTSKEEGRGVTYMVPRSSKVYLDNGNKPSVESLERDLRRMEI